MNNILAFSDVADIPANVDIPNERNIAETEVWNDKTEAIL